MVQPAVDVADPYDGVPMGEGGQQAADGLCTMEPCGRMPVAIIGGTGYIVSEASPRSR